MSATPAISQATWERRLARAKHLVAENRARRAAGDPDVKLNVYERLLLVARRAKERANRPAIRLSNKLNKMDRHMAVVRESLPVDPLASTRTKAALRSPEDKRRAKARVDARRKRRKRPGKGCGALADAAVAAPAGGPGAGSSSSSLSSGDDGENSEDEQVRQAFLDFMVQLSQTAFTLEEGKALARLFNKYATVEEPKKTGRDSRFDSKALQRTRAAGRKNSRAGAAAAGSAASRGRGQLKRRKSIDMTSFAQRMGQTLGSDQHVEFEEGEFGARGQISRENFQQLIQLQFGNAAKVLSDKIFSSLDNDESDAIDFREYLLGLAPLLKGSDQDILRFAFSACDLDGNGTIDSQELELLLDAGILEGEAAVAMIKMLVDNRARVEQTEGITLAEFESALSRAQSKTPLTLSGKFFRVLQRAQAKGTARGHDGKGRRPGAALDSSRTGASATGTVATDSARGLFKAALERNRHTRQESGPMQASPGKGEGPRRPTRNREVAICYGPALSPDQRRLHVVSQLKSASLLEVMFKEPGAFPVGPAAVVGHDAATYPRHIRPRALLRHALLRLDTGSHRGVLDRWLADLRVSSLFESLFWLLYTRYFQAEPLREPALSTLRARVAGRFIEVFRAAGRDRDFLFAHLPLLCSHAILLGLHYCFAPSRPLFHDGFKFKIIADCFYALGGIKILASSIDLLLRELYLEHALSVSAAKDVATQREQYRLLQLDRFRHSRGQDTRTVCWEGQEMRIPVDAEVPAGEDALPLEAMREHWDHPPDDLIKLHSGSVASLAEEEAAEDAKQRRQRVAALRESGRSVGITLPADASGAGDGARRYPAAAARASGQEENEEKEGEERQGASIAAQILRSRLRALGAAMTEDDAVRELGTSTGADEEENRRAKEDAEHALWAGMLREALKQVPTESPYHKEELDFADLAPVESHSEAVGKSPSLSSTPRPTDTSVASSPSAERRARLSTLAMRLGTGGGEGGQEGGASLVSYATERAVAAGRLPAAMALGGGRRARQRSTEPTTTALLSPLVRRALQEESGDIKGLAPALVAGSRLRLSRTVLPSGAGRYTGDPRVLERRLAAQRRKEEDERTAADAAQRSSLGDLVAEITRQNRRKREEDMARERDEARARVRDAKATVLRTLEEGPSSSSPQSSSAAAAGAHSGAAEGGETGARHVAQLSVSSRRKQAPTTPIKRPAGVAQDGTPLRFKFPWRRGAVVARTLPTPAVTQAPRASPARELTVDVTGPAGRAGGGIETKVSATDSASLSGGPETPWGGALWQMGGDDGAGEGADRRARAQLPLLPDVPAAPVVPTHAWADSRTVVRMCFIGEFGSPHFAREAAQLVTSVFPRLHRLCARHGLLFAPHVVGDVGGGPGASATARTGAQWDAQRASYLSSLPVSHLLDTLQAVDECRPFVIGVLAPLEERPVGRKAAAAVTAKHAHSPGSPLSALDEEVDEEVSERGEGDSTSGHSTSLADEAAASLHDASMTEGGGDAGPGGDETSEESLYGQATSMAASERQWTREQRARALHRIPFLAGCGGLTAAEIAVLYATVNASCTAGNTRASLVAPAYVFDAPGRDAPADPGSQGGPGGDRGGAPALITDPQQLRWRLRHPASLRYDVCPRAPVIHAIMARGAGQGHRIRADYAGPDAFARCVFEEAAKHIEDTFGERAPHPRMHDREALLQRAAASMHEGRATTGRSSGDDGETLAPFPAQQYCARALSSLADAHGAYEARGRMEEAVVAAAPPASSAASEAAAKGMRSDALQQRRQHPSLRRGRQLGDVVAGARANQAAGHSASAPHLPPMDTTGINTNTSVGTNSSRSSGNVRRRGPDGSRSHTPLLVVGPPGSGKSALVAVWSRRWHARCTEPQLTFRAYFAAGVQGGDSSYRLAAASLIEDVNVQAAQACRRRLQGDAVSASRWEEALLADIESRWSTACCPFGEGQAAVRVWMEQWLDALCGRHPLNALLVLDNADALGASDGHHTLRWLPRTLPFGAVLVACTRRLEDVAGVSPSVVQWQPSSATEASRAAAAQRLPLSGEGGALRVVAGATQASGVRPAGGAATAATTPNDGGAGWPVVALAPPTAVQGRAFLETSLARGGLRPPAAGTADAAALDAITSEPRSVAALRTVSAIVVLAAEAGWCWAPPKAAFADIDEAPDGLQPPRTVSAPGAVAGRRHHRAARRRARLALEKPAPELHAPIARAGTMGVQQSAVSAAQSPLVVCTGRERAFAHLHLRLAESVAEAAAAGRIPPPEPFDGGGGDDSGVDEGGGGGADGHANSPVSTHAVPVGSVAAVCALVWAAPCGVTEYEVLASLALTHAAWAILRRCLRHILRTEAGVVTLADSAVRAAVASRYLGAGCAHASGPAASHVYVKSASLAGGAVLFAASTDPHSAQHAAQSSGGVVRQSSEVAGLEEAVLITPLPPRSLAAVAAVNAGIAALSEDAFDRAAALLGAGEEAAERCQLEGGAPFGWLRLVAARGRAEALLRRCSAMQDGPRRMALAREASEKLDQWRRECVARAPPPRPFPASVPALEASPTPQRRAAGPRTQSSRRGGRGTWREAEVMELLRREVAPSVIDWAQHVASVRRRLILPRSEVPAGEGRDVAAATVPIALEQARGRTTGAGSSSKTPAPAVVAAESAVKLTRAHGAPPSVRQLALADLSAAGARRIQRRATAGPHAQASTSGNAGGDERPGGSPSSSSSSPSASSPGQGTEPEGGFAVAGTVPAPPAVVKARAQFEREQTQLAHAVVRGEDEGRTAAEVGTEGWAEVVARGLTRVEFVAMVYAVVKGSVPRSAVEETFDTLAHVGGVPRPVVTWESLASYLLLSPSSDAPLSKYQQLKQDPPRGTAHAGLISAIARLPTRNLIATGSTSDDRVVLLDAGSFEHRATLRLADVGSGGGAVGFAFAEHADALVVGTMGGDVIAYSPQEAGRQWRPTFVLTQYAGHVIGGAGLTASPGSSPQGQGSPAAVVAAPVASVRGPPPVTSVGVYEGVLPDYSSSSGLAGSTHAVLLFGDESGVAYCVALPTGRPQAGDALQRLRGPRGARAISHTASHLLDGPRGAHTAGHEAKDTAARREAVVATEAGAQQSVAQVGVWHGPSHCSSAGEGHWLALSAAAEAAEADAARSQMLCIQAHSAEVTQVLYVSHLHRLVTASADGAIRQWDLHLVGGRFLHALTLRGQPRLFTGHSHAVHAVRYTPNTGLMVSAGLGRDVLLWHPSDGTIMSKLVTDAPTGSLILDPVANMVAVLSLAQRVDGSYQQRLRVFSLYKGMELQCIERHSTKENGGPESKGADSGSGLVGALEFDPRYQRLLLGGRRLLAYERRLTAWQPSRLASHESGLIFVGFARASHQLLTVSIDAVVRVWAPEDGRLLFTFLATHGRKRRVTTCTLDAGGHRLLTGDSRGQVCSWHPQDGTLLRTFLAPPETQATEVASIAQAMPSTRSGKRFLIGLGSQGHIVLWPDLPPPPAADGDAARLTKHTSVIDGLASGAALAMLPTAAAPDASSERDSGRRGSLAVPVSPLRRPSGAGAGATPHSRLPPDLAHRKAALRSRKQSTHALLSGAGAAAGVQRPHAMRGARKASVRDLVAHSLAEPSPTAAGQRGAGAGSPRKGGSGALGAAGGGVGSGGGFAECLIAAAAADGETAAWTALNGFRKIGFSPRARTARTSCLLALARRSRLLLRADSGGMVQLLSMDRGCVLAQWSAAAAGAGDGEDQEVTAAACDTHERWLFVGNGAGEITAYDLAAVTGSTVSGPDAGVRLVTRWSAHDGPVASLTVIPPLSRGVRSKADSAAANDAGVDDPMNLHVASGGSGGDCRVMLHSGVGEFVGVFGQERAWVMRQSVDEECGAAATAAAKRRGPAAASRRAAAGQRRAAAAAGGGGVQPSPGGGGRPPRASGRFAVSDDRDASAARVAEFVAETAARAREDAAAEVNAEEKKTGEERLLAARLSAGLGPSPSTSSSSPGGGKSRVARMLQGLGPREAQALLLTLVASSEDEVSGTAGGRGTWASPLVGGHLAPASVAPPLERGQGKGRRGTVGMRYAVPRRVPCDREPSEAAAACVAQAEEDGATSPGAASSEAFAQALAAGLPALAPDWGGSDAAGGRAVSAGAARGTTELGPRKHSWAAGSESSAAGARVLRSLAREGEEAGKNLRLDGRRVHNPTDLPRDASRIMLHKLIGPDEQ